MDLQGLVGVCVASVSSENFEVVPDSALGIAGALWEWWRTVGIAGTMWGWRRSTVSSFNDNFVEVVGGKLRLSACSLV